MLFLKLSSFYFFYFATVGVYIIFLPKVLHDIGYTPSEIGIVLALAPLMRFLTPFLFLKHITLNKNLFTYTLLASVSSASLFYFTIDSFYLFMINNALLGVCLSLILPYIELIAIKELKNMYGKSRLFGSIGFALVGLVIAKILTDSSIVLHFYLLTTLFTSFFAYSLIKYDEDEKLTYDKNSEKFSLIKHWAFWLSLFLMQMSFGAYYNFFTLYENAHNINLEMVSYLWTFAIICEVLMFYYQAPLLKRNLIKIIKISILITAIRWILLFLFPDSLYISFITQGIHALSFGLYHSAVILYLYELYENKKLSQQFMLGIAYGLGGFSGSIVSGYFYGQYLFLSASIIALMALLALYHKRYTP